MEALQPEQASQSTSFSSTRHERHCFIVMPSGHATGETKWFRGWYDVVIQPATIAAGYEPKLATAEEHPSAINDEIRAHLAFDPMVVVDLGGSSPDADPNPNVMYELGIRHALGLPLVMMAWKGQRLPFDVSNQRVIMEGRDFVDIEANRTKLASFIKAAEAGHFYRPMEAVGRIAALEAAYQNLSGDSLLGALVREVRDLRTAVLASSATRVRRPFASGPPTVKSLLRDKPFRKELYPFFIASDGTPPLWNQILKDRFPSDRQEEVSQWEAEQWKSFILERIREWKTNLPPPRLWLGDEVFLPSASEAHKPPDAPSDVETDADNAVPTDGTDI